MQLVSRVPKPILLLTVGITVLVTLLGGAAFTWRALAHYFPSLEGVNLPPKQPVEFWHNIHAGPVEEGGDGIACEFCHRTVTTEAYAGLPAVEQCLFCHKVIATPSPEIAKLTDESGNPRAINWVHVNRLPDHVQFVHEAHVRFFTQQQGMEVQEVCTLCHGDVARMQRIERVRSLKMGDCVDCHRQWNAPTDCWACHY